MFEFFQEKSSDDDKCDDSDQQGGSNMDGLEMADGKGFINFLLFYDTRFQFTFFNSIYPTHFTVLVNFFFYKTLILTR